MLLLINTTNSELILQNHLFRESGEDGDTYEVPETSLTSWGNDSSVLSKIADSSLLVSLNGEDIIDISTAIDVIKGISARKVSVEGVDVSSSRLQIMNNRVPNGYSLYVTGEADNITNGLYGGGEELFFSSSEKERDFQLLNHYYAIGARAHWNASCDIDNFFSATLIAPASSGATQTTGDFTKVNLGGSNNIFVPVAVGAGDWSMDLTDTLANTNILKATPVPSTGNQGWFDYDSDTNTLNVNSSQMGGYNLFDFDINLHAFGRKIWGMSNGTSEFDVPDLVGKLLFNTWKIHFKFDVTSGILGSEKAAVLFIAATKGNISP